MRFSLARWLALLVVLAGLGFAGWSLVTRSPYSPWYVARWERVDSGLERMEFVSDDHTNVIMYRFDPQAFRFRIEHGEEAEHVKAWGNQMSGSHLVINGFYFLDDFTPAGLLITNGAPEHAQEFDRDKSGVVQLDPNFGIIDTDLEDFSGAGVTEAGQSYPFLFKHGQESIKQDSGLTARRTFIGTDTAGLAYVGVVWRDDVSLFELMQSLWETGVAWDDVLNLDGGPSTGLAIQANDFSETLDSAGPVPNVIVIEPR